MKSKYIFRALLKLGAVTPKFNWLILVGSRSIDDNLNMFFEKLPSGVFSKVIYVQKKSKDMVLLNTEKAADVICEPKSLRHAFYTLFAKFVVFTNNTPGHRPLKGQKIINLWHGMPFKRIGEYQEPVGSRYEGCINIATSGFFREIIAKCFKVETESVLVSGLPRNDAMFISAGRRAEIFKQLNIAEDRKVFFWMPTYRQRDNDRYDPDGKIFSTIFPVGDFDMRKFDDFLARNNAVCIAKPHQLDRKQELHNDCGSIRFVDYDWLLARGIKLYELIGAVDSLISDISSVIIDFCLLDRPQVIAFSDIEEYRKSRSFIFEPIEDYLPGRINLGMDGVLDDMAKVINGADAYREKRGKLKELFHAHSDEKSCGRLYKGIGII